MTETAEDSQLYGTVDPYGVGELHPGNEDEGPMTTTTTTATGWHGPLESIVMRPRIFALPIIVLVTLALLAGFVRKPVYSAESQLIVGSVVRDFQGADGQVQAITQLTDIYSRLVGSSAHMDMVDTALGESVPGSALTAAPIPNSALIRVDATGSTQEQAVARADAASNQLVAYVDQLRADASASGQAQLDQITAASLEVAAATTARASAQAAVTAASAASLPAAQQALQQAEATLTTATLKLDTLKANYTTVQQSNSGGIGLTVFAPAGPTGSDRKSTLQIYGIGAILIGGLLGMALATLAANNWQLIPRSKEPETSA